MLAWAHTNCEINMGCQGDSIYVWNNTTKKFFKQQLPSDFSFVYSLNFNPAGNFLALGGCKQVNMSCQSYEVIFWDITSEKMIGKPLNV